MEDDGGLVWAEVADGVEDPEDGGVELLLGADAAAFDGGEDVFDLEMLLEAENDADAEIDLGVADALRGEAVDHFVGDEFVVVGGLQALGDLLEGHEEALEIFVDVEGACGLEGEWGGVVALREGDQGFGDDGALEVEVEFAFGEAAEVVAVGLVVGHVFSLSLQREPVCAARSE